MSQPISLQSKLIQHAMISSILAGVLAWLVMVGLSSYQAMQFHDDLMEEIADSLVGDINQQQGTSVDEISEEFHIEYSLWLDDLILTSSEESSLINELDHKSHMTQISGFHVTYDNGRLIRTLSLQQDGLSTHIVQPISVRFTDLWQTMLSFAGVLMMLWVLQWWMLKFTVKRQLRPLVQISHAISAKNAHNLSEIPSPQPKIEELQPIVNQLNAMLVRLEQALSAEQRFTADASHELRSPLSAIQMRLQVLKRKYQDDPLLTSPLQQIQNDVQRGTQVLENLLLLARIDPNYKDQMPTEGLFIDKVLEDVIQSLSLFAEEKDIHFEIKVSGHEIVGNVDLIFSCLRNIVDNAIRYAPAQSQVNIYSVIKDHQFKLIIENAGHGLSDDVIARLGERFYRALGTKTTGSGLGLSICKKIMDLHQGKIQFSASVLGGLKVELDFPFNEHE